MSTSDDPKVRSIFYAAERSLTVRLRTGRVRKGCAFTEGANTQFQGLAADVTKEAVWRYFAAVAGGSMASRPVLVVHDEIVVECPEVELIPCKSLLELCMLDSFIALCPDAGPFAKVEVEGPLEKWGEATDKEGKKV